MLGEYNSKWSEISYGLWIAFEFPIKINCMIVERFILEINSCKNIRLFTKLFFISIQKYKIEVVISMTLKSKLMSLDFAVVQEQ